MWSLWLRTSPFQTSETESEAAGLGEGIKVGVFLMLLNPFRPICYNKTPKASQEVCSITPHPHISMTTVFHALHCVVRLKDEKGCSDLKEMKYFLSDGNCPMPYFKQGKHYTEVPLKVLLGLKGQRKSEGDISGPCDFLVLSKQRCKECEIQV